jgi:uncharacterized protein (TIGR02118 family)
LLGFRDYAMEATLHERFERDALARCHLLGFAQQRVGNVDRSLHGIQQYGGYPYYARKCWWDDLLPRYDGEKPGENAVLKLTFCLRRLSSLSLAEFQDYWLNQHGPLVRRLQPALGMARYVQVHRRADTLGDGARAMRGAPQPYDGVAELWWESDEGFRASGRTPEGREAGRLLLEDEAKFIDLAQSPLWVNTEHVIYDAGNRA